MTLVIEFYAGPGAGKTTTAAGLWNLLKTKKPDDYLLKGSVEFVRETAQEEIFKRGGSLDGVEQFYLLANHIQACRDRENCGAGIVITDTGSAQSLVYCNALSPVGWQTAVADLLDGYNEHFEVIRVFLQRNHNSNYRPEGRLHTLQQSMELDNEILKNSGPFDILAPVGITSEELWFNIKAKLETNA